MDERIKQRLVGALVLVALAVIFIPMILEGPEEPLGPVGGNLPEPPAFDEEFPSLDAVPPPVPDEDARVIERGAAAAAADTAAADEGESAKDVPPAAPEPPVPPAPVDGEESLQAWAVQVGSFSERGNAFGLRERLRELGYSAYVEQVQTDGAATYRVRVGPELTREAADAVRERVAEDVDLKGLVVRHP